MADRGHQATPPGSLKQIVNQANERARHPIDLNYIAISKDDWERIVGLVNRLESQVERASRPYTTLPARRRGAHHA